MLAEDLRLPKRKETCTYLERAKKNKNKNRDKRIGTGPAPVGGLVNEGGEASEPRRRAQQQECGGQSGEIPARRISAEQHSPAREACLLTHRGGGWELRLGLRRSDPRERTGVGGVNTP